MRNVRVVKFVPIRGIRGQGKNEKPSRRVIFRDQKVSKEIKKIRQLADQPAGPTRTSPFFQACAHGVNQLAQTFSFASAN
jgi:hypothetical protein